MRDFSLFSSQWHHNGFDSVSNHQPHDCFLKRLFRRRSKKTSKLCVTGLCAGNSPGTGEFPAQMASNAENLSIWWRHHVLATSWIITTVHQNRFRASIGSRYKSSMAMKCTLNRFWQYYLLFAYFEFDNKRKRRKLWIQKLLHISTPSFFVVKYT